MAERGSGQIGVILGVCDSRLALGLNKDLWGTVGEAGVGLDAQRENCVITSLDAGELFCAG